MGRLPLLLLAFVVVPSLPAAQTRNQLELIHVAPDHRHFIISTSKTTFHPWGFNYDHDRSGRLLEDYWISEWPTVASDFAEMKALGANVVRIHLQVSKFMPNENTSDKHSLKQLAKLVALAESTGLYLDVTGVGCYKKEDVPKWYNGLDETRRWAVQARFWDAVARTCHKSPAIFCYDLMNEPVVTEDKQGRDWTPGAFGDRYYVQRLTLDFAGRTPKQVARQWVDKMVGAIRQHDRTHLVTVGAIPWALTWPGAQPLLYSKEVSTKLDFVSVHFYPKHGELDQALTALAVYDIGKPLVVEEMFPLSCSVAELEDFIERSRAIATGWIGFYWGETMAEYQAENKTADAATLGWLEYFQKQAPEITQRRTTQMRN